MSSSVTSRLAVVHRDAAIIAQLDLRRDFELGLEAQRLAFVEMHVLDVRPAHHLQMLFFHRLLEILRKQIFEDVLADLPANRVRIRLAGALPGRNPGSLAFCWMSATTRSVSRAISSTGNRDFEFVLAAFD